jgi:hypothetical protein
MRRTGASRATGSTASARRGPVPSRRRSRRRSRRSCGSSARGRRTRRTGSPSAANRRRPPPRRGRAVAAEDGRVAVHVAIAFMPPTNRVRVSPSTLYVIAGSSPTTLPSTGPARDAVRVSRRAQPVLKLPASESGDDTEARRHHSSASRRRGAGSPVAVERDGTPNFVKVRPGTSATRPSASRAQLCRSERPVDVVGRFR